MVGRSTQAAGVFEVSSSLRQRAGAPPAAKDVEIAGQGDSGGMSGVLGAAGMGPCCPDYGIKSCTPLGRKEASAGGWLMRDVTVGEDAWLKRGAFVR